MDENLTLLQSESDIELNESNLRKMHAIEQAILDNKLYWGYKGIDFILNGKNLIYEDLADLKFAERNIRILVQAGLPDKNEDKAYKIIDDLREIHGIYARLCNEYLVEVLKKKHFFTDTQDVVDMENLADCKILGELTYRNILMTAMSLMNQSQSLLN